MREVEDGAREGAGHPPYRLQSRPHSGGCEELPEPYGVLRQRALFQQALERLDAAGAELGIDALPELLGHCPASRSGCAVDAGGEHGVERVGDVDDAGAKRNLISNETVRIPAPSHRS